MTSLIAWVGVDSRGVSSMYFASDSRISQNGTDKEDFCKKVFICNNSPEIFAYAGHVISATQTLSELIERIHTETMILHNLSADIKALRIKEFLEQSLRDRKPSLFHGPFKIIHGTRIESSIKSRFYLNFFDIKINDITLDSKEIDVQASIILNILGSGTESIKRSDTDWKKSDIAGTSRAIFSSFCDAIQSNQDKATGGSPQLVGLWRKGNGRRFGVIYNDIPYLGGIEYKQERKESGLQWRNEKFEVCAIETLARHPNAQPQPRPKNV